MSDVVEKHDLRKYMKLSHELTGAYWNDEEGLWHVKITGPDGVQFEDKCNLLFNGSGILKYVYHLKYQCLPDVHSKPSTSLTSS